MIKKPRSFLLTSIFKKPIRAICDILHRCQQKNSLNEMSGREHISFPNNRILLRGQSAKRVTDLFSSKKLAENRRREFDCICQQKTKPKLIDFGFWYWRSISIPMPNFSKSIHVFKSAGRLIPW